jgi:hypothetical protein
MLEDGVLMVGEPASQAQLQLGAFAGTPGLLLQDLLLLLTLSINYDDISHLASLTAA